MTQLYLIEPRNGDDRLQVGVVESEIGHTMDQPNWIFFIFLNSFIVLKLHPTKRLKQEVDLMHAILPCYKSTFGWNHVGSLEGSDPEFKGGIMISACCVQQYLLLQLDFDL